MGKGVDIAREAGAGIHAEVIETFKEQLLLAFLRRLGGAVSIPVAEVDETGNFNLSFSAVDGVFHFTLERKQ